VCWLEQPVLPELSDAGEHVYDEILPDFCLSVTVKLEFFVLESLYANFFFLQGLSSVFPLIAVRLAYSKE